MDEFICRSCGKNPVNVRKLDCVQCREAKAKAWRPERLGTKAAEWTRTAEMLPGIAAEQGVYFVLQFLLDSGYERADLAEICQRLERVPGAMK